MNERSPSFLDGNAAAGPLAAIFAVDLTAAAGKCAGCGNVDVLAAAHVYTQAPGMVVRCPSCDGVLLRVVEAPLRTWLDLRGLAYLQFATDGA